MNDVEQLISEYRSLQIEEVVDHEKFNSYAITHHSTSIEGSTLTEIETRLLLDEGLSPNTKPMLHVMMVKDHYTALLFVIKAADNRSEITINFIKEINAKVMADTGTIVNSALGSVDVSKGEFRRSNVQAGNTYFINYDKVEVYTKKVVDNLKINLPLADTLKKQLELSFAAHFDLVTAHPFYDGNGRTSRLLMNFVQRYFSLPMAIVYKEDKAEYFTALQETRAKEDIEIFNFFMYKQYAKMLLNDINSFKSGINDNGGSEKNSGSGNSFSVFF